MAEARDHYAPHERGVEGADLGERQRSEYSEDALLGQWRLLRNACADARLSAGDLAVLAVLIDHYNRREQAARPGLERIAKLTGRHRTTVIDSIKKLEALDYVCVARDSTRANRYEFNWPDSGAWPAPSTSRAGTTSASPTSAPPTRASARELVGLPLATSRATTQELVGPALPEPALEPTYQPADEPTKSFAQFWQAFPRKEAKQKALKAWADARITHEQATAIIDDVKSRIADLLQWRELAFIPLPATYLRERRWEDEWTPAPPDAKVPGESVVERIVRLGSQRQDRDAALIEGQAVRVVRPQSAAPSPPDAGDGDGVDAKTRSQIEWINHQIHLGMIDEANGKQQLRELRELRGLAGRPGAPHGQ